MGNAAPAIPTPDTKFFRDVFNASPIGIAVEDLDGRPLFVNPAFCSMLGFSEEELRSKHCVDFSPPEDAEKDWVLFRQLRAGAIDHYQIEKRYFRRDGSLVWGSLSISLLNTQPSPLVIAMVEDITEKRRARDDFESVITYGIPAGVTRCSRDLHYRWANRRYANWLQRPLDEIVDRPIIEVLGKDAFESLQHHFERVLSGENVSYEQQANFNGIGPRWIRADYTPTLNADGLANGWVAVVTDITRRKQTEEALLRHAAIVESSEDAIASATLDGIIVSWNTGAERMYGYTESEAVGKPITILVPPELSEEENKILETLKRGGRVEQLETIRITKTGKRVNVSLSISPIKDSSGAIAGVSGIARDITDRKQAEEALRASEERLRLAQKVAGIGTFERNLRTGVNTWTEEMELMYGLPPGSFEQTQAAFERLIHPEDRAAVRKLVDEASKTGQPTTGEWRIIWPDGGIRWIAGRWQFLMSESGEPARVVGVDMDITERKRAEEALAGMTRKLIEAQEQERSRIARELHDDINQRLAMLSLELEQLKENPSEVGNRVRDLRKQITEISNDVQSMSHDLHSSKLEYLGVAAGMKSWCKEFAERQKIEIDFKSHVPTALPLELGLTLFRILQEALHNAVKHSGIKRVYVQLQENSGEIHLIISDSGKGFDVEAALQGEGLGLTSMRERIRLVNGTINIQSKPMGGTTIYVRVPLALGYETQKAAG